MTRTSIHPVENDHKWAKCRYSGVINQELLVQIQNPSFFPIRVFSPTGENVLTYFSLRQ